MFLKTKPVIILVHSVLGLLVKKVLCTEIPYSIKYKTLNDVLGPLKKDAFDKNKISKYHDDIFKDIRNAKVHDFTTEEFNIGSDFSRAFSLNRNNVISAVGELEENFNKDNIRKFVGILEKFLNDLLNLQEKHSSKLTKEYNKDLERHIEGLRSLIIEAKKLLNGENKTDTVKKTVAPIKNSNDDQKTTAPQTYQKDSVKNIGQTHQNNIKADVKNIAEAPPKKEIIKEQNTTEDPKKVKKTPLNNFQNKETTKEENTTESNQKNETTKEEINKTRNKENTGQTPQNKETRKEEKKVGTSKKDGEFYNILLWGGVILVFLLSIILLGIFIKYQYSQRSIN